MSENHEIKQKETTNCNLEQRLVQIARVMEKKHGIGKCEVGVVKDCAVQVGRTTVYAENVNDPIIIDMSIRLNRGEYVAYMPMIDFTPHSFRMSGIRQMEVYSPSLEYLFSVEFPIPR